MEVLEESLKANITAILPHLEANKLENLVEFLIFKGVKKERDLRRLTVQVLEGHLQDLVDASDLHEEWQKAYGDSTSFARPTTPCRPAAPATAGSSRPLISVDNLRRELSTAPPMPEFLRDSPYIPSSVRKAIDDKKRAPSSGRTEMVERIVDNCRETVPQLTRAMFIPVARQLVSRYPETFKDTLLISEHGADSLIKQFQVKFDNSKRPNSLTVTEKAAPAVNP